MKNVREKIKMMSVNQIAVYHTLLEAFNIMRHSSSEQIHKKWTNIGEKKYSLKKYKKLSQSSREALVEMFGFYLQWSKVV